MEKEQHCAAKGQLVALMQAGHSWQEAASLADIQISRSAAYRLLQKVLIQGEGGLQDGRHGHPAKLREPVQQWLKDYCHAAPGIPSHIVQQALANHFGILVSISHLNATRAALGLGSRVTPLREKKGVWCNRTRMWFKVNAVMKKACNSHIDMQKLQSIDEWSDETLLLYFSPSSQRSQFIA